MEHPPPSRSGPPGAGGWPAHAGAFSASRADAESPRRQVTSRTRLSMDPSRTHDHGVARAGSSLRRGDSFPVSVGRAAPEFVTRPPRGLRVRRAPRPAPAPPGSGPRHSGVREECELRQAARPELFFQESGCGMILGCPRADRAMKRIPLVTEFGGGGPVEKNRGFRVISCPSGTREHENSSGGGELREGCFGGPEWIPACRLGCDPGGKGPREQRPPEGGGPQRSAAAWHRAWRCSSHP